MPTSLIVVDEFLSSQDARRLRDAGLRLTYPPQAGAFPGRNSVERLQIPRLDEAVSRIVGEPVRAIDPPQSHGKFRITLAGDEGRARVHIDPGAYWSGILYLSRPGDCRGGTEFYRHLPTGTDQAPTTRAGIEALGFRDGADLYRNIIERDTNDGSKWERTMHVPMRFNRLVLLRPWMWHTAGEAFGDSLENGRFVYLMFFASAR